MNKNRGTKVLDEVQVNQKIKRIAYEIYENNFKEKKLFIAGIEGGGYRLAEMIKFELDAISPLKSSLLKIHLDKSTPTRGELSIEGPIEEVKNHVLLLVDDVQNTGRTFTYGMRPFLNIRVKKIEVAVLVNRDHMQFPVAPTYTGYELSTTLEEHIHVNLEKGKKSVYLY
jgi:pyrimidine operon attenuation protein/uracil phosphoribosyltransferase